MRYCPAVVSLSRQLAAAAPILAFLVGCTGTAAPTSQAYRIGTLGDTIGGPHAIGRIGDFMLENDQIRLVIADTGVAADPDDSVYGRVNTTFGGSLVDADLRRAGGGGARGNDQLAELLPGFVFTVINPTKVSVTADGSDGRAAEVTVEGTGGDLLQMVGLLNQALVSPANLAFTQTYRLAPGKKYVEIETTIKNKTTGAHPFPYLDPSSIDALLGTDIPGIGALQLSVPMGQLPLLGGEQDLFAPGFAGFNVQFAIEDTYAMAGGFPAFPGMVVDFLASKGRGVSYGLTMPESPDNYVNAYASGYPGQDITPYSMLLPFTYAGVAGVYMAKPPSQLMPQQEFTFTSYFVVGDGDVGSVYDTILELRGVATGTFGGRVLDAQTSAPIGGANVLILDENDRPISQLETDAGGSFAGNLPPGQYSYRVLADDRLNIEARGFTVRAGEQTGAFVEMQPPATLAVSVIDELGRHAPAKVLLVGNFDDSDEGKDPRDFLYELDLGEGVRPTAYDGGTRFTERAWFTVDGRVSAPVRPGKYKLVVSRGPEYETTSKDIELTAGAFVAEQLTLERAYVTPGWIAIDTHIHAQPSTDSGVPIVDRVISCAAEGLDVAVATDHNYITDYAPAIAASGLDPWLLGISGVELTTFEMGHFNGFPLKIDPGSTRGGEFRWAGLPPGDLFTQLRNLAIDPGNAVVQVNHPRQQVLGYFAQFFVDSQTGQPYIPTGILGLFAPYGDEFAAENFSYDFDAVELMTGRRIEDVHTFRAPSPLPPGPFPDPQPVPGQIVLGSDGRPQFPGVVETWFAMLDRGHTATGMGTSDTHHLLGHEPGYARTLVFVGEGNDLPGSVRREQVIAGIRGHHAITTNAPFITMTTNSGGMIGDTVEGSSVEVTVRVQAPSWAKVDHVIIYSNGGEILAERDVPSDQGTDFETTVTVRAETDAWVVAEATGTQNMYPVLSATEFPPLDATVIISALSVGLDLSTLPLASNLKPIRTHPSTPYAITNPIWIDRDGNGWTPPQPRLPKVIPHEGPRPDVRAQFDAFHEVAP